MSEQLSPLNKTFKQILGILVEEELTPVQDLAILTQVFFEDNQFAENILILIYVSLVYSSEIYWLSEIKPSKSEIYGLSEIKSS